MKVGKAHADHRAWTYYWAGQGKGAGSCLPELPEVVRQHLLSLWERFFLQLPPGSRLLDLGTGNGALLALAKACRSDLHLTGVDYAANLPDPGPGITVHPKTRMEALPFEDNSFEAVTGQFAIEYGNLPEVIGEVKRVLVEEGRFLFICHHAGGIIVRDNGARLVALRGILGPGGLLEAAIKAVRKRQKNSPKTRQRLARIFEASLRTYAGQSVVQEVGGDIARIMTEPQSLQKLLELRRRVEMEKQRIEALEKAALPEDRAREVAGLLSLNHQAGLDVVSVPGVELPLAWRIGSD
ncbi:MAG: hypothetical protein Kow0089_07790 [Desulfobulbaceae bacterium]